MREIKFRGLTANGNMVYGYLVPDLPNSTIYYKEYSQRICWYERKSHHNIPVKNGTVGQYTGLKDKNGVEIYEGDIVCIDDSTSSIGKVYWDEIGAWFIEYGYNDNDFVSDHAPTLIEVIGNIYENPELLEVK